MVKVFIVLNLILILILNYGCTAPGVLATGGGATMVVVEGDRTVGVVIDDASIKLQIASKFISSENDLFLNIDSSVIEGRVLLTGIVDLQEIRIDAVRRVWEIGGVKEVINEIEVGDKTTLKEYSQDLWINTQVKGMAAKTLGLRALSFNFETIKGKVYIAGITSRKEQLEELINSIENIKGIKEIVNYAVVKEE